MAADATEQSKDRLRVHVRWMIHRDRDDVLDIEAQSHEFPWDDVELEAALKPRSRVGMVAELSTTKRDVVAGYIIYDLQTKQLVIQNMAVHPDYRRRGIGTQLVKKLMDKVNSHDGRTLISLMVDEKNLSAQKFFASCGFRGVGVTKDFYVIDGNESRDAFAMAWSAEA